jgi:hypothetical protein
MHWNGISTLNSVMVHPAYDPVFASPELGGLPSIAKVSISSVMHRHGDQGALDI